MYLLRSNIYISNNLRVAPLTNSTEPMETLVDFGEKGQVSSLEIGGYQVKSWSCFGYLHSSKVALFAVESEDFAHNRFSKLK